MSERKEALMRIVVAIVTGIILSLWKTLVQLLVIVNWFIVIFTGERNKGLAEFCEIWNTQVYVFLKYITFVSNDRPFPFTSLAKNMDKFE
jgi:hypothetical protein